MATDNQRLHGAMWKPLPEVQTIIDDAINELRDRSASVGQFEEALHEQTGETILRRIDHLAVPAHRYAERLTDAGFTIEKAADESEPRVRHPRAFVPRIYLCEDGPARCAFAVESVDDFMKGYPHADPNWQVEGIPGAPLRRCRVATEPSLDVWVVERWGSTRWRPDDRTEAKRKAARRHLDAFRRRPRDEGTKSTAVLPNLFRDLRQSIRQAVGDLGQQWTAALFFRAEREHWVAQTPAAQVRALRQDAWGLGWAHHDHHTYRCSRAWFSEAIAVLELLGLVPRESFYAGAEAGWGAQVLEHPSLPFVVFADVDLSPNELTDDFGHRQLKPRGTLGTVGLWCGLHGEAVFGAGLHHLACHFDFDVARLQLQQQGVEVMPPFTELPELRQAFTVASLRPVARGRLDRLRATRLITATQAESFAGEGALGSHLEIIERRQAYKGFHQKGINSIITRTDPRTMQADRSGH